jgi:hypothetical protein
MFTLAVKYVARAIVSILINRNGLVTYNRNSILRTSLFALLKSCVYRVKAIGVYLLMQGFKI